MTYIIGHCSKVSQLINSSSFMSLPRLHRRYGWWEGVWVNRGHLLCNKPIKNIRSPLLMYGLGREKTCLCCFRENEIRTSLLSYRDKLENCNFACSKFRYDTSGFIQVSVSNIQGLFKDFPKLFYSFPGLIV